MVVVVWLLSCVQLLQPHKNVPTRLLCWWDFLGQDTGVGCHFLLQGIFPGIESISPELQADSLQMSHQGSPYVYTCPLFFEFPSHLGHRRALSRVPCTIYEVLTSYLLYTEWKVKAAQPCPTLCDPIDCTVHGILQAKILEWVAFPFFRGSFQAKDRTQVSRITSGLFSSWATREALYT